MTQDDTNDPIALMSMFEGAESGALKLDGKTDDTPTGEQPAAKAESSTAASDDKSKDEPKDGPKEGQKPEVKSDGVLARDGKNVIPMFVLDEARTKRAAAEARVAELQEQVNALQAEKAAAAAAGTKPNTDKLAEQPELSEEELATIAEEFPAIAKLIKGFQVQVTALKEELRPVKETTDAVVERAQRSSAEQVQDAIDGIPQLAYLQQTGGDAWETALDHDRRLRGKPEWKDKSYSERFAHVLKLVEVEHGPIVVPVATTGADKKSAPNKEPDAAALAKAAAEKLASEAAARPPNSLSALKSGDAPAVDEMSALTNGSVLDIAARMGAMTPDALDAYLKNLS